MSSINVCHLTCEYRRHPLGVDTTTPALSWHLTAKERNQRQIAYQIQVASQRHLLRDNRPDLWDSGRVDTASSIQVPYAGTALGARQTCFWRVRVWDQDNKMSDYSTIAFWEMGLLTRDDWQAQWIRGPKFGPPQAADVCRAPLLRKAFRLNGRIKSARIYLCGLGYAQLYINGKKMSERCLDPVFTRYDKRALYTTYDVTSALQEGENAIGVLLGNGYFNQHLVDTWGFEAAPWRDFPKVIAQLHVYYADGRQSTVVTDPSWRSHPSPILFDQLRSGEIYDAREEIAAWSTPQYDDAHWQATQVVAGPGGELASQMVPPIRVGKSIRPQSLHEVSPGVFIYDFGQNISGWAQLKVEGARGTRIDLRYAELLREDGQLDQSNINTHVKTDRFQTDTYILKGEGREVWSPRFAYHGFRYVELRGLASPDLDTLTGCFVHTDFADAGYFRCANDMLNRLQDCTRRSYLGNFVGIPTDCPHREKNGWTGDAHIAAETGLFNFAAAASLRDWLQDFADEQRPNGQFPGYIPTAGRGYNWGSGPAWDSAYILIAWYLYLYCGDQHVLADHYDGMKRYISFMDSMATDNILFFGLGDWCPPGRATDGHKSPTALTSTAYYYIDTLLVSHIGALLGHAEEAAHYKRRAAQIKEAFNAAFYDPATAQYAGETQTSLACALYQGLVPASEQPKVLQQLINAISAADYHLDCGILGTKYVMQALRQHDEAALAYRLATQTSYPSWGHWLAQGTTTLWETWEGIYSGNHIMFGDISAWFFKTLAGINPDPAQPGFKHTLLKPHFIAGLDWVEAEHMTPFGLLRSAWRQEKEQWLWEVEIPVNTTATLHLPANITELYEGNQPANQVAAIRRLTSQNGYHLYAVGSGRYHFRMVPAIRKNGDATENA